jgi:hypothetical protein
MTAPFLPLAVYGKTRGKSLAGSYREMHHLTHCYNSPKGNKSRILPLTQAGYVIKIIFNIANHAGNML